MKIKKGFTLAEVLITLAIIGVVSALVIPSVLKNYNDKKYNTARLKALKTFGEAGKMASINGEINGQPSARAFVENVLSKYLKITKICDNNKASECNFPERFKTLNTHVNWKTITSNSLRTWTNLNGYNRTQDDWTDKSNGDLSIYITTADGFSAKLFYNPKCVRNSCEKPITINGKLYHYEKECHNYALDTACMNIIYDMNGIKSPNQVGEDIGFVTVFWSGLNATAAAPGLAPANINTTMPKKTYSETIEYCSSFNTKQKQYTPPTIDELSSVILNKTFTMGYNGIIWSSTRYLNKNWTSNYPADRSFDGNGSAYCVRR